MPAKARSACSNTVLVPDPDIFFDEGNPESVQWAQSICASCPLATACRDYARREGIEYGVWGGEGTLQRRHWWHRNGGRPEAFSQLMDSVIPRRDLRPLDLGGAPVYGWFCEAGHDQNYYASPEGCEQCLLFKTATDQGVRTVCKNEQTPHELTPDNTYTRWVEKEKRFARSCRQCMRETRLVRRKSQRTLLGA